MREQRAIVIPLPLSVVESNVWDVATWNRFLSDVEWIDRQADDQFVFGVRNGRRLQDVPLAVQWYPHDHRMTWRQTQGPLWRGEVRMTALNGRRTRLGVETEAHPRSFVDNVAELLGDRRGIRVDFGPLVDWLERIPQPFNPARMEQRPSAANLRAARVDEYLARTAAAEAQAAQDAARALAAAATPLAHGEAADAVPVLTHH